MVFFGKAFDKKNDQEHLILRIVHEFPILMRMVLAGGKPFPHQTRQTIEPIALLIKFRPGTILQLLAGNNFAAVGWDLARKDWNFACGLCR